MPKLLGFVLVAIALFIASAVAGLFPNEKFPTGDGLTDVVTANSFSDDVTVLTGQGDGTFVLTSRVSPGESPRSVAVGDFDQDGRTDLVTANRSYDDVLLLLGRGDGTFARPVWY